MEAKDLVKLSVQVLQLMGTLYQAVEHIAFQVAEGTDVNKLKGEVAIGLQHLLQSLIKILPTEDVQVLIVLGSRILDEIEALNEQYVGGEPAILVSAKAFKENMYQILAPKLFGLVQQLEPGCLEEDVIQFLFEYFGDPSLGVVRNGMGLLCISQYTTKSFPLESYENTVEAFNTYEDLHTELMLNGKQMEKYIPVSEEYFDTCPICHGSGVPYYNAIQILKPAMYVPGYPATKLWMKCNDCENLWAYNFPKQVQNTQQTIVEADRSKYAQSVPVPPGLNMFSDILNRVAEYTSGRTMLEVGIGKGEMIATALEFGYEVDSVEIGRSSCESISNTLGVDIVCADFIYFETDKKYDILSMGDVVEHVSDPVFALKKAYDLLKSDGVLWLSTPNYESAFSRFRKFDDPMWCAPYHFTYFSHSGLLKILDEIGFEEKCYDVCKRYNGSMELILTKK